MRALMKNLKIKVQIREEAVNLEDARFGIINSIIELLNVETEKEHNFDLYDEFFADFDGTDFCELKHLKLHHDLIKHYLAHREHSATCTNPSAHDLDPDEIEEK